MPNTPLMIRANQLGDAYGIPVMKIEDIFGDES